MLDKRLNEQLQSWTQLKQQDVPKINQMIKEADLPALTVAPVASPAPPVSPTPASTTSPSEQKSEAMPTTTPSPH
jgi:hypothetical protein